MVSLLGSRLYRPDVLGGFLFGLSILGRLGGGVLLLELD